VIESTDLGIEKAARVVAFLAEDAT